MQGKFFDFRNFAIRRDRLLDEKVVFVTSQTYTGNLGGLAGADAKCQERADVAGWSGTFKAWLSDGTASVFDRFDRDYDDIPFVRTDGAMIANGWGDLTDGTLLVAIKRDESGNERGNTAWTNTNTGGRRSSTSDCNEWTSAATNFFSRTGEVTAIDSLWTRDPDPFGRWPCINENSLYCFQQVSFWSEAERLPFTIPNSLNCKQLFFFRGKHR